VWIAARALQHRFPLATRDSHFNIIDDLVVLS
jgi:predicted nucleic acid-binding protein